MVRAWAVWAFGMSAMSLRLPRLVGRAQLAEMGSPIREGREGDENRGCGTTRCFGHFNRLLAVTSLHLAFAATSPSKKPVQHQSSELSRIRCCRRVWSVASTDKPLPPGPRGGGRRGGGGRGGARGGPPRAPAAGAGGAERGIC